MKKKTWSIEILPQNVSDIGFIPDLIKEIFITMIPGKSFSETILAAQKIQAVGGSVILRVHDVRETVHALSVLHRVN